MFSRFLNYFRQSDSPSSVEKPESLNDFGELYIQWDKQGSTYGPIPFEYVLDRYQKKPFRYAQFDKKGKVYSFEEIMSIVDSLKPSSNQLEELEKLNFRDDTSNLSFTGAHELIRELKQKRKDQRATKVQENKKLPATKRMLKELDARSISYQAEITREEASKAIKNFDTLCEVKEQMTFLIDYGLYCFQEFNPSDIHLEEHREELDYIDMYHFSEAIKALSSLKIEKQFDFPISKKEVLSLTDLITDAIDQADDYLGDISDKEIDIGEYSYKITGNTTKLQTSSFKKHVIKMILNKEWNEDGDLLKSIRSLLPEVVLNKINE